MKLLLAVLALFFIGTPLALATNGGKADAMGRKIVHGPIHAGLGNLAFYNVHIISDSVGIISPSGDIIVHNSVIEAPICIKTGGTDNEITNNIFKCRLAIQFTSRLRTGNLIMNNSASGRLTN